MSLQQLDLFSPTDSGALFSSCGRYRYTLWRRWADGPAFLAIMLNPSTADATCNDPTVERVQRRAHNLGYGQLVVCNVFAFRATDPQDMKAAIDPIGVPENDRHIIEQAQRAQTVMVAWGAHGNHLDRARQVMTLLKDAGVAAVCLGKTAEGHPRHPLYVGYDTKLEPFSLG